MTSMMPDPHTPVIPVDAVASLKRWGKRDVYAISVFAQVDELTALSCVLVSEGGDYARRC